MLHEQLLAVPKQAAHLYPELAAQCQRLSLLSERQIHSHLRHHPSSESIDADGCISRGGILPIGDAALTMRVCVGFLFQ